MSIVNTIVNTICNQPILSLYVTTIVGSSIVTPYLMIGLTNFGKKVDYVQVAGIAGLGVFTGAVLGVFSPVLIGLYLVTPNPDRHRKHIILKSTSTSTSKSK